MNKSGNNNRSVRNTKKKLRNGLMELMKTKPINEITAKELTELVDINRGTFYFHYSDVYDLLHQIEDEFFDQFHLVLNNVAPVSAQPYLTAIFSFLEENQDLCRIMLGNNGDIIFMQRIQDLVDEKCSYFWQRIKEDTDKKQIGLYNAFIISGCMGIMRKWLDDGLRESPEEISALAATIITASADKCFF